MIEKEDSKSKYPPILIGAYLFFLLTDFLLPSCPIALEYFIYDRLELSKFEFFDKSMVASTLMIVLIAFVKAPDNKPSWRISFGVATLFAVAMLATVLVLKAEQVSIDTDIRKRALSNCYTASFITMISAILLLSIGNFWSMIIWPLLKRI